MPDPQPTYNEAIAEARSHLVQGGLAAEVLARIREALARALVDLQVGLDEGTLAEDRGEALRASIDAALRRFRDRAVVVLEDGRDEAIVLAVSGHVGGLEALGEQDLPLAGAPGGAQIAVGESFADVPDLVREVAATRRTIGGAATMRTLVNRNVEEAAEEIDDVIDSSIGRGVDNERFAKDIAAILARGDEELQETMERVGRTQGAEVDPDAAPVSIAEDQLPRASRLEYDARRIAVSEVNSHYHEADVISAVKSPVVDLVRWKTSSQHTISKRYVPDICDFLETTDLFGYGEGLFHPAAAPSLVHPHCMCRYESVMKDPEDYGTPSRDLPDQPEVPQTLVDEALKALEGDRTVTEAYAKSQTEMLDEHLDAAFSVAEQLQGASR
jgi:hypothetical protein